LQCGEILSPSPPPRPKTHPATHSPCMREEPPPTNPPCQALSPPRLDPNAHPPLRQRAPPYRPQIWLIVQTRCAPRSPAVQSGRRCRSRTAIQVAPSLYRFLHRQERKLLAAVISASRFSPGQREIVKKVASERQRPQSCPLLRRLRPTADTRLCRSLYSITLTAKMNRHRSSGAWLADVLSRIAEHPANRLTKSCRGIGK